jgi:hypothetical protein
MHHPAPTIICPYPPPTSNQNVTIEPKQEKWFGREFGKGIRQRRSMMFRYVKV